MAIVGGVAGGLVLTAAFALIFRNAAGWGWLIDQRQCLGGWWEAEIEGCRTGSAGTPVEPVNTYSNLAYYAAGYTVFVLEGTMSSVVFALAMTFLCIGSAMYHGLKTIKAAALDHAGMYAVFTALAIHAMAPVPAAWIPMAVGSAAIAWFFRYRFEMNLHAVMGLLLGLTAIGAFFRGSTLLAGISMATFLTAFAIWTLGKRRIAGGRWGHGLWHLLTAAAIALMYNAIL